MAKSKKDKICWQNLKNYKLKIIYSGAPPAREARAWAEPHS